MKKLGELLFSAQTRVHFDLSCEVYDRDFYTDDDADFRLMVAELRLWKTVPGFDIWGLEDDMEALEQRMRESEA